MLASIPRRRARLIHLVVDSGLTYLDNGDTFFLRYGPQRE
jgi:hypothetical protein